jgi:endo-1,4-beta-mannosidase
MSKGDSTSRRDFLAAALAGAGAAGLRKNSVKAGGRAIKPGSRPRFGVNYTPSKNWWYCWLDWDAKSIAEDLRAIAALGMDHVRIQCLWSIFQPNINYVSESALLRLRKLLDLADHAGLDVEVTVLDGWLSGYAFYPAWIEPKWQGKRRNIFTDAEIIEAEKLLFGAIATEIGHHPRFLGFDLGNELGVLQLRDFTVQPAEADVWASDMLSYCERVAPGRLHVNGVDHNHWFSNVGFSRGNLSNTGGATVLHAYILFTGALERYGYNGVGSLHLAEYCIELARAYQKDLSRPIWLQEFGATAEWMPASYIKEFAEQTIRNAASCASVWGFTWWCSHDLNPRLKGFASLEYSLGLLDRDNHVKPSGELISKLIREFRDRPPEVIPRPVAVVISDEMFSMKAYPPDWKVGKAYMDLVATGVRPAIVLENRLKDTEYLNARGIKELVHVKD